MDHPVKRLLPAALTLLAVWSAPAAAPLPSLIPMPAVVEAQDGRCVIPPYCGIDSPAPRVGEVLRDCGLSPTPSAAGPFVHIHRAAVENPRGFPGAYQLAVTRAGIDITAPDDDGIAWAAETLRQLLPRKGAGHEIPCVVIRDWPAFPMRGFMIDAGRNYQSPALLREEIEVMARYKLNVFHFHLTDNPGWRLESRILPAVNASASMSRTPGKFYTQQEFRDLAAFCHARRITLVPELDMPGHSEAFRKALGISSMNAPETRAILKRLLTELASLAPPDVMPWIHLGTDEVRGRNEAVDASFLPEMAAHVRSLGRGVIGWHKGIEDPADTTRITQLWARANPLAKNPYLDSRLAYVNHMDPFDSVPSLLFRQFCGKPAGDDRARGAVLCSWPDIRIENERDQLRINPIYPAILAFSESIWRGNPENDHEETAAGPPRPDSPHFARFAEFETRLLDHKQRFFQPGEFPYTAQSAIRWKLIGPFPHGGDVTRSFPVESRLADHYDIDGKSYRWLDHDLAGATVHIRHFFGFPSPVRDPEGTCYAFTRIWSPDARSVPAWIGFQTWSTSDRRSGPTPARGEWHATQPWIRINGSPVDPPAWSRPPVPANAMETPVGEENYTGRPPMTVRLHAGWNEILLKLPHRKSDWKWMFTFAPVGNTTGLKYDTSLPAPTTTSR